MIKKILAGLAGIMLVSSIGLAAPVTDLNKRDAVVGFNRSSLKDYEEIFSVNGFYAEAAVYSNVIFGIDYNKDIELDDKTTDIYAKYKLKKSVNIILGNRNYTADTGDELNKIIYGIDASAKLADRLTGYAAIKHNNIETELKFGTAYALAQQVNLDINYIDHKFADSSAKGFGFGLNFIF